MFRWQGYAPRRTGASRIVLEASLLVPLLIAFGVGCLAGEGCAVGEVVHSCALGAGRPWWLAGAACVVGILSLVGVARYDVRLAPSANDVRLWR